MMEGRRHLAPALHLAYFGCFPLRLRAGLGYDTSSGAAPSQSTDTDHARSASTLPPLPTYTMPLPTATDVAPPVGANHSCAPLTASSACSPLDELMYTVVPSATGRTPAVPPTGTPQRWAPLAASSA